MGASKDDRYTGFQVRNLHTQTSPPKFAVIANWNIATPGAGGGWHGWTSLDNAELARDPLGAYGHSASFEMVASLARSAFGGLIALCIWILAGDTVPVASKAKTMVLSSERGPLPSRISTAPFSKIRVVAG